MVSSSKICIRFDSAFSPHVPAVLIKQCIALARNHCFEPALLFIAPDSHILSKGTAAMAMNHLDHTSLTIMQGIADGRRQNQNGFIACMVSMANIYNF